MYWTVCLINEIHTNASTSTHSASTSPHSASASTCALIAWTSIQGLVLVHKVPALVQIIPAPVNIASTGTQRAITSTNSTSTCTHSRRVKPTGGIFRGNDRIINDPKLEEYPLPTVAHRSPPSCWYHGHPSPYECSTDLVVRSHWIPWCRNM